jgi:hypothetical protein
MAPSPWQHPSPSRGAISGGSVGIQERPSTRQDSLSTRERKATDGPWVLVCTDKGWEVRFTVLALVGRSHTPRLVGSALRTITLALAVSALGLVLPSPHAEADTRPTPSTSYYLKTTRPKTLDRMGCDFAHGVNAGRQPDDALVVMAFGRPMLRRGQYGASLFGVHFATTSQIRGAGIAFAAGFRRCISQKDGGGLRIVLGTSNYGSRVSYGHGKAWAGMVNVANRDLEERGWNHQIDFAGGIDIELAWNGPRPSKNWVHGYDSVNLWPYYDFGDAGNCPPFGDCFGSWTMEDVWYVAWGAAPAIPLPEIYTENGSHAEQWYRIGLYSQQRHGSHMAFAGLMSQRTACDQSRDSCRGMNNGPRRAWRQFSRLLNSREETAQRLRWSTDISWHRH